MSKASDVTVIVPTFNRGQYITECINSLLSQTIPPDEIIVINDGSTDDTRAVLQRFTGQIHYVEKENGGKSTAINLALPKVKTKYVWFFDDDDVAHPWAIESHLKTHALNSDLGFSFGFHAWGKSGPDGQIMIMRQPEVPPIFGANVDAQRLNLFRYCAFMLTACLCKTEAVRSIGSFDTALKRSQDYDFLIRMGQRYQFAYTGSASFVIREHDGLRGTADSLHSSKRKRDAWLVYDQMIGRKLAQSSELHLFLAAERPIGLEMSVRDRRLAHLNRAAVMFSKALLEEGVADLTKCAELLSPSEALTDAEFKTLASTTEHPYFRAEVGKNIITAHKLISSLCYSEGGRRVLKPLLRGLYWQLRQGEFGIQEKLTILRLAIRLWLTKTRAAILFADS